MGKKISIAAVIREMRNMKRRKGGMRRADYEMTMDMAWQIAWMDNFERTPVEYVELAEQYERERMERFVASMDERIENDPKYADWKRARKRKHNLRVIEGGAKDKL